MDDPQLIALESKIAFLEHTVQSLNDALADQERRIAGVERNSRILMQRLGDLAQLAPGEKPADEKPPHY